MLKQYAGAPPCWHFEGKRALRLATGDADRGGPARLCRLGDGLLRGSARAGRVAIWGTHGANERLVDIVSWAYAERLRP